MWTRTRDEPDGKSGEVLQTAVQTISSQAKAGYSNSQQKGTLRATPKERRNEQSLI
ncbi:hypothetical protein QM953_02290 [Streptococcus cristatus]|nr:MULTISPECIES: hypothetical protein [Streptococcus]MCY7136489.1 hypothetical protein [Streptococcus gordonii]MDE8687472.1 hypothetical protein [Streptococcus gordonii]MDL2431835.1 hypothetical protein [Streptococcus sp. SC1]